MAHEHGGESRKRIEHATLKLTDTGSCGVLVPGGFVLTATHGIRWEGTGNMTLADDEFGAHAVTNNNTRFRLGIASADPVSDLAVLTEADSQQFGDDCDRFGDWCDSVEAVPISEKVLQPNESITVHVLTHDGRWVAGTVTRYGIKAAGRIAAKFLEPVRGGTSGSPVVDADGHVFGIISQTNEVGEGDECNGMMPVLSQALPRWIWTAIAR